MASRKPPILMQSGLTGRVYIVTSYKEIFDDDGDFQGYVANTKFDVTEQFGRIAAELARGEGE